MNSKIIFGLNNRVDLAIVIGGGTYEITLQDWLKYSLYKCLCYLVRNSLIRRV